MSQNLSDWADASALAAWFGVSKATLRRKLPALYEAGFPRPCPIVHKWYLPRCREWAGAREPAVPVDDPLLRALDGHGPH